MNQNETESEDSKRHDTKPKRGFPRKLTILTLFIVAVLGVMHLQTEYFNEQFNMNPAAPWLATILLGILTFIFWSVWTFFFAKLRLVGLLIFSIPVLFFTFYYPNFLGDANFAGFKPRFWTHESDYATVTASSPSESNLLTETEFDFPQFLGPNRNGRLPNAELADSWDSKAPELLWKHDVGEGWSGFAAVNGYGITQEQRGADECITCYELETGNLIWNYKVTRRHEDTMAMGKVGPRATPTIDNGWVYATSATGVLDCIDGSTGELKWSASVPELVGIVQVEKTNSLGLKYTEENSPMAWGRSCSPLILDDLVVVTGGGPLPSKEDGTITPPVTLIAFDKQTGEEKWRGGNRMIAYGSPTVVNLGGTRQIVLVGESLGLGHDAETGEELWSTPRPGKTNGDANCSQATYVDESRLIFSKGYNAGGELVEVKQDDGKWAVKTLKQDPRVLKTKLTNPILYQGHAYSLSDGYLECTEVDTLRRKWKQRGRFGNGQILLVGDKLLVHAEGGRPNKPSTLYMVKASPEKYEQLGTVKTIEGICWNTLCVYKDLVIIRSDFEAACFRLPTKTVQPTAAVTE